VAEPDLGDAMAGARGALGVHWTPERAAAVEQAMARRGRRRARQRAFGAGALAAGVLLAAWFGGSAVRRARSTAGFARGGAPAAGAPAALVLADGSRVVPTDGGSVVEPVAVSPLEVTLRLRRGGAHFEVARDAHRVFRVEAGGVAVQVLGTVFDVQVRADGARVGVAEGRVRVFFGGHAADLGAGEARDFRADGAGAAPGTLVVSGGGATAEGAGATAEGAGAPPGANARQLAEGRSPGGAARATPRRTWQSLAHEGDYDAAYELLSRAPRRASETVDELLMAADVARLSHHPQDAVAPLARLLERHGRDPRAPLAAFTLGRVLLEELGRPRDAAPVFARAERLDPAGPLAEDALSRQVEALSRAGDTEAARTRAEEYLRRYPQGRWARAVHRFGGL
jgi:transmembrane sensor